MATDEDSGCNGKIQLPSELPLIVLSDCFHFPGCYLPLFIFEERYRAMLNHVLLGQRMFGVGVRTGFDERNILPVTTAGLVSRCVKHEDGTSNLLLFGLRRMRITGQVQVAPFPIVKVEPMESDDAGDDELAGLRDSALDSLPSCPSGAEEAMNRLKVRLQEEGDPEVVCDILSYHFIRHPVQLAEVLQEPSVKQRYRLLLKSLRSLAR